MTKKIKTTYLLAAALAIDFCLPWNCRSTYAVTTTVNQGESSHDVHLSSYDVEYVYGTANGTAASQFSGQVVYGNGKANNTTLKNSSYQWVYDNSVINETNLYDTAVQILRNNSTANNTTLSNSSEQRIYNHSLVEDTVLNHQAKQYIYDASEARNTILNGNTKQAVLYDGSRANNTTLNDNSEQRLYNGAVVNEVQLNDTAQQVIQETGTANNTILNDNTKQIFYGNGTANNTTLNGNSSQSVYNSSIVHNTRLNDNAYQVLNDTSVANHSILSGSSKQSVYNHSIAYDIELNDQAIQLIHDNSMVDIVKLNDMAQQVIYNHGIANHTELSDTAQQYIYEDGTAKNTSLYGSSVQLVDDSGTALDTELYEHAQQKIYSAGLANNTILNGNSSQHVLNNATANTTIMKDSSMQYVGDNGTVHHTILHDTSNQIVYGSGSAANDTALFDSALQYLVGGSQSYRSEINDQSVMIVESGAKAYDTIVNGGTLYIQQHSVLENDNGVFGAAIKINRGGTLAVTEDGARVDGSVAMNGGTIDFMRQGEMYTHTSEISLVASNGYKTFTVDGDLNGGGQLSMSTNVIEGTSDHLLVTGNVTGIYQVGFTNDATAAANGNEIVQSVIQPSDGTGVFLGQVEYGGYVYNLQQNASGYWDLVGLNQSSSSGSASYGMISSGYLLNYAESTSLHQRLGDLRRGEVQDAPWVRVYDGRFCKDGDLRLSGYDMSYRGLQVGLDRKEENGWGTVYDGVTVGYNAASQNYNTGNGATKSTTLGLYRTFVDTEGRYADLVFKYGWVRSAYRVRDTAAVWVDGEFNTQGRSFSIETGKRTYRDEKNKEGWYVEPQAQFSFGHQSGGRFVASNGLAVEVDSYNSVLGRLGIIVGYEMKREKRPMNVYTKFSYIKEFDGAIDLVLNGRPVRENFGGSWWSYGAGIAAHLSNDNQLYLDVTRDNGGSFKRPWQLNVGLRGQFN